MPNILVVFNPRSRSGAGAQWKDRITNALAGMDFAIVETTRSGQGFELAAGAVRDGATTVVAAGGDGTVNEVLNGMATGTRVGEPIGKLAIFPIGSANDLAWMLGCAREPEVIAQRIRSGQTRRIDIGHVRLRADAGFGSVADSVVEHYFANNAGIGFEAQVTLESQQIKRQKGTLMYVLAALRALGSYSSPHMDISWVTDNGTVERWSRKTLMISIGNSSRTGGSFYLTPGAVLDDGLFDLAIAKDISRWRILLLLPKALFGKHTTDPAITMARCRTLSLRSAAGVPIHLDGEVVMKNAREIDVELQPKRLEIIV